MPAPTAPSLPQQDGSTLSSNPATADGPSTAPAPSPTPASELATLRAHIQTLTELNNRLQAIRHIPAQLLRPPGSDPHKLESALLTHGFRELAAVADVVRSEKVQDALKTARKSEQADPANLGSNLRRENLKRRCVGSVRGRPMVHALIQHHADVPHPLSRPSRTARRSLKTRRRYHLSSPGQFRLA